MKMYRVIVDGQEYEVGVEPLDASETKPKQQEAAPEKKPEQAASPVKKPERAVPAAGGEAILSPMPGNILSVSVQNGSPVKKGQVLLILEAMKMENEIISPRDGTVASVNVRGGMTVESGAVLCTLQ